MTDIKFTLDVQGVAHQFRVESFTATEALSTPFQINLSLLSLDADISFSTLMRKPALLTLYGQGTVSAKMFHGIINEMRYLGQGRRFARYQLSLVPQFWFLTQRQDCRIFQHKSIPVIISEVLDGATISNVSLRLSRTYLPREYVLQYRETDSHFLERLLSENGMWYYFEHHHDHHIMVIVDSNDAIAPLASSTENGTYQGPIKYHNLGGGKASYEHIFSLELVNKVRATHVSYTDYNDQQPRIPQYASYQQDAKQQLALFDYPGRYTHSAMGELRASERVEGLIVESQQILISSDVMRFASGYSVNIVNHPRRSLNQEYTLISAIHHGSSPGVHEEEASDQPTTYQNECIFIPRDIVFRAPKLPAPVIDGPQTAVVVGPENEEIYTDKFGRIKVQFHWDRYGKNDQHSSCWIRVSQSMAASTWGAVYLPRIGHEVIITFLEGDPDRPLVTGALYNGLHYPPYSLPENKTRTTFRTQTHKGIGHNELSFEDEANQEEIYIHAQKNMFTKVLNSRTRDIGKDEMLKVGRHQTKRILGNQEQTIEGNKTTQINQGFIEKVEHDVLVTYNANETQHVKKSAKLIVGDERDTLIGLNDKLDIAKNSNLSIGMSQCIEIGADSNQTIGGNLTVSVARNISFKSDAATQIISANKIIFKTGAASLVMSSDGAITLSGTAITLEGADKVVVKGGKVAIN